LIVLDRKARRELEQLLTDGNTAQKIAKRARIVLMTADGHGVVAIMREVGVSKTTVWRWQDYFAEAGVDGLIKGRSKPPGRKPLSAAMKLKVVEKTVKERPANATHWSVRLMAEEMGIGIDACRADGEPLSQVHAKAQAVEISARAEHPVMAREMAGDLDERLRRVGGNEDHRFRSHLYQSRHDILEDPDVRLEQA
jgi:transposase